MHEGHQRRLGKKTHRSNRLLAIVGFTEALSLDSNLSEAHLLRGRAYLAGASYDPGQMYASVGANFSSDQNLPKKESRAVLNNCKRYSTLNFDTSLTSTSMFSLFSPLMMFTRFIDTLIWSAPAAISFIPLLIS